MAKYARILNGRVAEILQLDADPAALFHADLVATMRPATPDVEEGWSWDGTKFSPAPAPALEDLRAAKIATIIAATDADLARGAPVEGGLRVALDDGSRADLTALASTATAVVISNGAIAWPDSYARGWITMENVRVPLATASEALAFAAAVGGYYSAIVQHRRDLKDAALAATSAEELDAITV